MAILCSDLSRNFHRGTEENQEKYAELESVSSQRKPQNWVKSRVSVLSCDCFFMCFEVLKTVSTTVTVLWDMIYCRQISTAV
jgi:hypothetical protein